MGRGPGRPLHRIEGVEGGVGQIRQRADVEVARAVVLEARQRRVLAEDVGGRPIGERIGRSPSGCATCDTIHQSGLASPGSGRNGRCREMRRSELVTVPSFSPHAAAGSSTGALGAGMTVSLDTTFSETTSRSSFAQRLAHDVGARQRHGRVGAHHPQRLDVAARDGLEHVDGLEAFAGRDARRAPEAADAIDVGGRKAHMGGELVGEPADLASAHGVGLAGERERPHAGLADAAGGEMAVDDGVDLVGALRRLVDALREAVTTRSRGAEQVEEARDVGCASRPVAAAVAATSGAMARARASASPKSLRVVVDEGRSSAPVSARWTSRPLNSAASVPGAMARMQVGVLRRSRCGADR